MHLRRPLALTTTAVVLSLGGLTSCGFDLATDRPYQPGVGTNDRQTAVAVLASVIVAAQPNEGTVVVTLVNSTEDEQSLSTVTGSDLEVGDFDAVAVPPRGHVNLADDGGVPVTGDFDAGDVLSLTFSFDNGESATFDVPVVTACGPYEGLDVTEDSENIPYDCDAEPSPVGGSDDDTDPAGGDAEESE